MRSETQSDKSKSHTEDGMEKFEKKVENISNSVNKTTQKIADQLNSNYEELKENAEQCSKDTIDYVKKHPLKSVAIAAGIGVIIGYLYAK